jgi:hypothetical protein
MTISNNSTRVVVTLGAGATSTTFNFDYFDTSDIEVYFDGVLKNNADYSISNKTVTFTSPLTKSTKVSIILNMPYGRSYDYISPEEFDPNKVNPDLNRITLQILQIRDKAVQVSGGDGTYDVSALLDACEAFANGAQQSSIASGNSATSAGASATLAEAWANSDTVVAPNKYSAKHWAGVASAVTIPNGSITNDMLAGDINSTKFDDNVFKVIKSPVAGHNLKALRFPYDNWINRYTYHIAGLANSTSSIGAVYYCDINVNTAFGITQFEDECYGSGSSRDPDTGVLVPAIAYKLNSTTIRIEARFTGMNPLPANPLVYFTILLTEPVH